MDTVLNKLILLEKKAIECGFVWPNSEMAIDQVISEGQEVRQAIAENEPLERIQEEIGDLIHASLSLCMLMELDVAETLAKTSNKFEKRLLAMLEIAKAQGYPTLKGQPTKTLLYFWDLAKLQTDKP